MHPPVAARSSAQGAGSASVPILEKAMQRAKDKVPAVDPSCQAARHAGAKNVGNPTQAHPRRLRTKSDVKRN
jgi:hypothetical protein